MGVEMGLEWGGISGAQFGSSHRLLQKGVLTTTAETRVTEDTRAPQRRSAKQLNMPELLEMGRSGAHLPELTLQPPQARTC